MDKTYYFYRKAIEPSKCEFYDHTKGIVGYFKKQSGEHFLHGTIRELDERLSFKRPTKAGARYAW